MLQNAYFLAKIGADTAKNEQHFAEILPIRSKKMLKNASGPAAATEEGDVQECCDGALAASCFGRSPLLVAGLRERPLQSGRDAQLRALAKKGGHRPGARRVRRNRHRSLGAA